jgi:hypothetical protein
VSDGRFELPGAVLMISLETFPPAMIAPLVDKAFAVIDVSHPVPRGQLIAVANPAVLIVAKLTSTLLHVTWSVRDVPGAEDG